MMKTVQYSQVKVLLINMNSSYFKHGYNINEAGRMSLKNRCMPGEMCQRLNMTKSQVDQLFNICLKKGYLEFKKNEPSYIVITKAGYEHIGKAVPS
jgi:hypothetical protein